MGVNYKTILERDVLDTADFRLVRRFTFFHDSDPEHTARAALV